MSDTDMELIDYKIGEHPDLPPPPGTTGVVGWMRANLFAGPINTILTIITIVFLVWSHSANPAMDDFRRQYFRRFTRPMCGRIHRGVLGGRSGADISQFTYGFYPEAERWRPILAFILLFGALVPILFESVPHRGKALIFSALYPFIAYALLLGGEVPTGTDVLWSFLPAAILIGAGYGLRQSAMAGLGVGLFWIGVAWAAISVILLLGGLLLEPVKTRDIGGFLLTLVIGITGITVSLPIGVVLALGRKSDMLIVRWLCTGFIEFIRGVPLITLLFVASTMLNYFLPPEVEFDLLLRVLIMVTLFASAYMAEVIRGGLQAIPRGQYEAADAMGLKYWQSMRLIVLPQALKISIPGIVNTFIGLYKDTTLVYVIGMLDPLGISRPGAGRFRVAGPVHGNLHIPGRVLLHQLLRDVAVFAASGTASAHRTQTLERDTTTKNGNCFND